MTPLRLLPALLLPWIAAAALAQPPGLLPALSVDQWQVLERGEVVVTQLPPAGGQGYAYKTYGLVEAAPARVWGVIQDCEHLDEYMPRMALAVETEQTETSYVCETEIDLPFPLSNRRNKALSILEQLPGGIFKRHWSLTDGNWDYYRHDGSWTIHPWGEDGERSLLENWIDSWPKNAVPDFIVHAARTVQAPEAFEAIRKRVRSISPPSVVAGPPGLLAN
ncbi:MAG: hypothetical protein JRH01_09380 [Deltaproteobacteria bacterium]|nr:hypothetical protein [Deltaproteobacteria bacterium]MBW2393373.1 hypothetical protein [Deltaproteobacteria bacterium]